MNAIQMEPEEEVLLVPFGLHSWIVNLYWTNWAVPFVCFSFFADRT